MTKRADSPAKAEERPGAGQDTERLFEGLCTLDPTLALPLLLLFLRGRRDEHLKRARREVLLAVRDVLEEELQRMGSEETRHQKPRKISVS